MSKNFDPFRDKRTVAEVIKARNQRENERTDKVINNVEQFLKQTKKTREQ